MVAIVYARVSTEDQAKRGYSLPDQLAACRTKATSCGATRILECVDEGISGEVLNRPGLEKARQLIRAGSVDLFVCLDPDRLARKLSLQLLLTEELDRAHIKLDFVNFDWRDTPEGRLFYSMRGAIAEYEKEKIRERTMRGKMQKAKQGLLTHSPGTFGYIYEAGALTIDPQSAAIVKLIYDIFIREEIGTQAIAERLNEMGLTSPRGCTWQKATVKRILSNRTYTGTLYLNRYNTHGRKSNKYLPKEQRRQTTIRPQEEWIAVEVPRIIDDVTFAASQRRSKEARRLRPGLSKANYLLSGIVRCGRCGRTMHGCLSSGRQKARYRYYVCSGQSPGDPPGQIVCKNGFHSASAVEETVWQAMVDWFSDIGAWVQALEEIQQPAAAADNEHDILENELEEIRKERDRLLTVLQRGLVSFADVESRLADLQKREQKIQDQLINLLQPDTTFEINPLSLQKIAAKQRPRLESLDEDEKKQLLRQVVTHVVIGPEKVIRIKPKVPVLV